MFFAFRPDRRTRNIFFICIDPFTGRAAGDAGKTPRNYITSDLLGGSFIVLIFISETKIMAEIKHPRKGPGEQP